MSRGDPICIYYHRDFDGMVSAAVLAAVLTDVFGEKPTWESVNYDQRRDWEGFARDQRFGIVDFHFHPARGVLVRPPPDHLPDPRAARGVRAAPSKLALGRDLVRPARRSSSEARAGALGLPSRPSASSRWPEWSDIIDAARYESVEQAVFGDTTAAAGSHAP